MLKCNSIVFNYVLQNICASSTRKSGTSIFKLPSRIKASSLNECLAVRPSGPRKRWRILSFLTVNASWKQINVIFTRFPFSMLFLTHFVGCCRTYKTYDSRIALIFHSNLGRCLGANSSHLGLWKTPSFHRPNVSRSQGPDRRSSLFSASQLHPYHVGGLMGQGFHGQNIETFRRSAALRASSFLVCFRRSSFSKEQRTWLFKWQSWLNPSSWCYQDAEISRRLAIRQLGPQA